MVPFDSGEMSRMQAHLMGTLKKAGRWEGVVSRLAGEEFEGWPSGCPWPSGCLWPCYLSLRSTAIGRQGYFDGEGRRAGELVEQGLHSRKLSGKGTVYVMVDPSVRPGKK